VFTAIVTVNSSRSVYGTFDYFTALCSLESSFSALTLLVGLFDS